MTRTKKLTKKQCHLTLLQALKKLKREELREMFLHLDDDTIDTLGEILYNLLCKGLPMTERRQRHLSKLVAKHERDYHHIIDKTHPVAERRKLLRKQSGGSLGLIFNTLVPLFEDLISHRKK